jgi:hypothetical protein
VLAYVWRYVLKGIANAKKFHPLEGTLWQESFNIAPTQKAAVVRVHVGAPSAEVMRRGLSAHRLRQSRSLNSFGQQLSREAEPQTYLPISGQLAHVVPNPGGELLRGDFASRDIHYYRHGGRLVCDELIVVELQEDIEYCQRQSFVAIRETVPSSDCFRIGGGKLFYSMRIIGVRLEVLRAS